MQRAFVAVLLVATACGDSAHVGGVAPDAVVHGDASTDSGASSCSPPMLMCGSVCTNLANDPNNCGTCGHVCGCGSTTCTAGMCDAHVLADQQGDPVTLALNNGVLYWGTDIDRNGWFQHASHSLNTPLFLH